MNIIAHCLVKNEENFLWYSIGSVVEHVDKILLWDTGSSDNTVEIIKKLQEKFPGKILFKEVGSVNPEEFSKIRQEMLDETDSEWVMVLDGDEIWPEESIKSLVDATNNSSADVIVAPFVNFIGDIFHYQDNSAGRYKIDGKVGNYSVKAFKRNIKGLKVSSIYGSEGYTDESGSYLQESSEVVRSFIKSPFFHATHLARSRYEKGTMGRKGKVKHELGDSFAKDFFYPEAFFKYRPDIVKSPWTNMSLVFRMVSWLLNPIRKIKRKII